MRGHQSERRAAAAISAKVQAARRTSRGHLHGVAAAKRGCLRTKLRHPSHSNLTFLTAGAIDLAQQTGDLEAAETPRSQRSTMISSVLSTIITPPVRILIASTAWNEAITATAGPSTPAVSQVPVIPGGGAPRRRSADKAFARQDGHGLAVAADTPPKTQGFSSFTATSLIR